MIDAIFLDLGGVILEIDFLRSCRALGLTDEAAQQRWITSLRECSRHHEFERGQISADVFFAEFPRLYSTDPTLDAVGAWNKLIVGPLAGADRIFDEFGGRVPIYALSNTNRTHYDHMMRAFPILSRFDRLLTSFELGARKPEPEIYHAAARAVGVRPERSVFIDDLAVNVEAARAAGFRSHQTVNAPAETVACISFELENLSRDK